MKKTLLLLLFLSFNSFAMESCQYVWDLSGRGINLGKSYDSFKIDSNIELLSSYEPSKFVSVFGVKKVNRLVNFNEKKMFYRKEEQLGKNNENIIWNTQDNFIWEKFLNNQKIDQISIESNELMIDSTSFPYLAKFNLINLNIPNQNVTVLSKGFPYHANISIKKINDETLITHKVSFNTDKKTGTVFLNAQKEPLEFNFTDENGTLLGKVIKNNCS